MKVISAITGVPSMSKEEVDTFLENKLNLQIGTIDEDGDPNIQPVWFDYDKERKTFDNHAQGSKEDQEFTK